MDESFDATPGRPAARVEPTRSPGVDGVITLGAGIVAVAALYFAREVLIPITLAILLSFLVAPLANFLSHLKLGRIASVLFAVIISVSVIGLIGSVIGNQMADLASDIPRYQANIEHKINVVHGLTIGKLNRFAGEVGQAVQHATVESPQPHESSPAPARAPSREALPVELREPVPTPVELVRRLVSPVISPLETAFIVFVVTIVILLQRDDLRDRVIRLFGSRDLHRTTTMMDEAARRLSRYFVSQLGINAGVGVVIGIGLFFIGVPSPLLWGILAALLRLVPYVGIWIAAALATGLAAAVSLAWPMAIGTLALFVVVELVVSQIVEPLLYGHSTGLSPFSVVVAAIFWSWIWGPIGLILSTPLTLCLLVLGRHVRRLEFLDVLLGDQPALTPIENFYRRALAGDLDKSLDEAESLMREGSLSTYYDDVVIKGLQLAADDMLRGGMTAAQLTRIETMTNDLIEGLDGIEDVDLVHDPDAADWGALPRAGEMPVPSGVIPDATDELAPGVEEALEPAAANRVICIAGRGPLDALAATMLVQVLSKHEFDCRLVPYEAASRAAIRGLDATAVTLVVIFYLRIEGMPSHLRYLVRRVRERLPQASIVIGLWPSQQIDQGGDDLQSVLGADYYAASIRDMVAACERFSKAAEHGPIKPVGGMAA